MTGNHLSPDRVMQLAVQSQAVNTPCDCARKAYPGWESQSSTFPEELLECVGSVAAPADGELTVQEYHPDGTSYWSPDAPIALHYFPANRSTIWQCRTCQRAYARYTEYGGYYVDRRIRSLQPALITQIAGPDAGA